MEKNEVLDVLESLIAETEKMTQEEFDLKDKATIYSDICECKDEQIIFGLLSMEENSIEDVVYCDEKISTGYCFHEDLDMSTSYLSLAA